MVRILLHTEGIYCGRTKSLFENNFGKSELIGTKCYIDTSAHVARSPENLWWAPPNGRKMAVKKTHFPNFLVIKTTNRLTHLPAANFREI